MGMRFLEKSSKSEVRMGKLGKFYTSMKNKSKTQTKLQVSQPEFDILYKPLIDAINTAKIKGKTDCIFGMADLDLNSVLDYKELMKLYFKFVSFSTVTK